MLGFKGNTGFTAKEMEGLRRIAVQCGFAETAPVLSSQEQLDMCVRMLVQNAKSAGKENDQGMQAFLSKLYDYRKKIEIDKPQRKSISNSRQISNGQPLQIFVANVGVFKSQIVKNTSGYMTISRPVNRENVSVKEWRNKKISIYFWREGDAGYVFDAEVTDEVYSLGILSLKISHSFSLSRIQKRKSVRVKMNTPAFLYLVSEGEAYHKIETAPGLKCILEDLSDTGCAVTVGGKASDGLRVKVQFELNNAALCISGTVRSTIHREDTKRSVLHVEADPLPTDVRNRILGKVFGTMEDYDGMDMLFRLLDDEAAGAMDKIPARFDFAMSAQEGPPSAENDGSPAAFGDV